jgi:hypothetical protein
MVTGENVQLPQSRQGLRTLVDRLGTVRPPSNYGAVIRLSLQEDSLCNRYYQNVFRRASQMKRAEATDEEQLNSRGKSKKNAARRPARTTELLDEPMETVVVLSDSDHGRDNDWEWQGGSGGEEITSSEEESGVEDQSDWELATVARDRRTRKASGRRGRTRTRQSVEESEDDEQQGRRRSARRLGARTFHMDSDGDDMDFSVDDEEEEAERRKQARAARAAKRTAAQVDTVVLSGGAESTRPRLRSARPSRKGRLPPSAYLPTPWISMEGPTLTPYVPQVEDIVIYFRQVGDFFYSQETDFFAYF